MSWERGRLLSSYKNVDFVYDGSGERFTKTVNGVTTRYITLNGKLVWEESSENTITYLYGATGLIGCIIEGTQYYYAKNMFGDVVALIRTSDNTIVAQYVYDAWGNHKVYDSNGNENTDPYFVGNLNPIRYRSYYWDSDVQLYYLHTRWYDPEIGRFINLDQIEYLDPEAVNGLNLYAYCNNNPVMGIDPDGTLGLFISFLITSIVIGAAMGGAVNTYKAYKEGASGGELVGAFFAGAIMGGAMGAVMAIGGAAGLASLGISTTVVGGSSLAAFGISFGIGLIAGGASYAIKTWSSGEEWSWSDFALSGVMGGLQAAATFGIAFAGGRAGLFNNSLTKMSSAEFLQYIVNTYGNVSNFQALVYASNMLVSNFITRFLLCSIPGAGIRALIEKLIKG